MLTALFNWSQLPFTTTRFRQRSDLIVFFFFLIGNGSFLRSYTRVLKITVGKKDAEPIEKGSHEVALLDIEEENKLLILTYYSLNHVRSADYFARRAAEIENAYKGSQAPSQELIDQQQAYVIGSVFASVAFLEAMINEVFRDAVGYKKGESRTDFLQKLSPPVIISMAQAWEIGVDWSKEPSLRQFLRDKRKKLPDWWYILDKYQLALFKAHSKPFDKKDLLWKEVEILVDLRNLLTHHKPEWITFVPGEPYKAENKETAKLMKRLEAHGFSNPILPGKGHDFLDYLGAGCANWAVDSSLSFVNEFSKRVPLKLPNSVSDLILNL